MPSPTFTQQALMGLITPQSDRITGDDGILGSGVDGQVLPTATPSMGILVNPAIFVVAGASYTSLGPYLWTPGTSPVAKTVTPADSTNPRIDLVTVQVTTPGTSTVPGQADIVIVAGTPASSPSAPLQPAGSLLLASIAVAANATVITAGNITDQRSYTTLRQPPAAASPTWQNLSLGSGVTVYGTPYATPSYLVDGQTVVLRGVLAIAGTVASGGTLATFPSAYAPSNMVMVPVVQSGAFGRIGINSSGVITNAATGTITGNVVLDGIRLRIGQ